MNFSDLELLFQNYDIAKYTPSRTEVHFGCECGCGGDLYTKESWDLEEHEADEAILKMIQFCDEFNINYDGIL